MPITVSVVGSIDNRSAPPVAGEVKAERLERVLVGASRAGAAPIRISAAPDDAVGVEFANGLKLWMRVEDLHRQFGVAPSRGQPDGGGDVWEIDPLLRPPADERGLAGAVVKALDFVGVDLAGKTAAGLSEWFEAKQLHAQGPGIFRVDLKAASFSMAPADAGPLPGGAPLLVFLHGTASSTAGSFGELWERGNGEGAATRKALEESYQDRVFALEHRSLTLSPIDNALDLARRLPDGAELHLVSHSRGGLIGELLCLGDRPADGLDWDDFAGIFKEERSFLEWLGFSGNGAELAGYAGQWTQLQELAGLLEAKRVRVKRFVRTACPARGTTLASGRLDRWLSVLSYAAGGDGNDFVEFILAVVKERTDPRSLPGLEAMMPGSALVRLLNHPRLQVDADLSVIAGDIASDGIAGWLKLAVPDLFFGGDHDLVVNTGSMYGGLPRRGDGGRFYFDRGSEVCHFNYFANRKTVQALRLGLLRPDNALSGFTPLAQAKHEAPARSAAPRRDAARPGPLAFVIPGIMGSGLQVNGKRVWLDYRRLVAGDFGRLRIDAADVAAAAPLDVYYGDFIEYLGRSHKVVPFAYDWRKSMLEAADRLAVEIECQLPLQEASGQPVRLVAHSTGGLVARAMIARRPDLWQRMQALDGCRLLMLGTPNSGSHQAVRLLVGQHKLVNLLALADATRKREDILEIFSRFPGVLELLPAFGSRDFTSLATWQDLAREVQDSWPLPEQAALASARATWQVLRDSPIDPQRMCYVAGWASQTAVGCEVGIDNGGRRPCLRFPSTPCGDGTVPWEQGAPNEVRTWYLAEAGHDRLLAHEPAFAAYLDLLQTGTTHRLPDKEPAASREAADHAGGYLPPDLPPFFPEERDFAGFGSGWARPAPRRRAPRVAISVRHGDLRYAHHPVCVGHYTGDTVVSAEAELDRSLRGQLTREQRMGLYPGRLGTWRVFINPERYASPAGAIVLGLGQVGELTPGGLEAAMARALMDYALKVVDCPDDRFGPKDAPRSARVSFLLIGTGAGGMSARDSIEAILGAVTRANEQLVAVGLDDKVLIDRIELIELFHDLALQAARELDVMLQNHDFACSFDWSSREVKSGDGGRLRVRYDDGESWWQRLEIAYDKKRDELRFIALTNRARAEEALVSGQMRLADDFIREATGKTDNGQDISRTLFEMLLPNRLKEFAPDRRDLVLLVDEISARFPWELLEDRWTDGNPPLAVAAGMVRQLKTPVFRAAPAHPFDNTAYVVGNPRLPLPKDGKAPAFPDLPGARAEAQEVATLLGKEGTFHVREAIDADADDIMIGLHAGAWRVLHLAGHGVHSWEAEYDDGRPDPCPCCEQTAPKATKKVSGMVIGDGIYLTPGDIEQMRWVPELVFINCCHLGNTGVTAEYARYNRLAASVAVQFVKMGVRAVLAAGWAVNDAAAKAFAATFYRAMLRGESFGRAVQEARADAHKFHPSVNTWGAYQCYGDPDYRLVTSASDGSINGKGRDYLSPSELVIDLGNLRHALRMGGDGRADGGRLLARIPADRKAQWLKRADVAEALGLVFGECGEFAKAVEQLDNAGKAEGGGHISTAGLEQRANFRSRQAKEIAAGDVAEATNLFAKALEELDRLLAFGQTSERYYLVASTYKRMAMVFPEQRQKALQAMVDAYAAAEGIQRRENGGKANVYPLLNRLLGQILIGTYDSKLVLAGCTEAEQHALELEAEEPNFWNSAALPEAKLLRGLVQGNLASVADSIVAGYRAATERGASKREFCSILDHFEFLESSLRECERLAGQLPALTAIATKLRALAAS